MTAARDTCNAAADTYVDSCDQPSSVLLTPSTINALRSKSLTLYGHIYILFNNDISETVCAATAAENIIWKMSTRDGIDNNNNNNIVYNTWQSRDGECVAKPNDSPKTE